MAASKNHEDAITEAITAGKIDIEEMEDVLELYRELYPLVSKKLSLAKKVRIPSADEAKMRMAEGFTLLEPEDLMPKEKGMAKRAKDILQTLVKHSDDDSQWGESHLKLAETETLAELVTLYLSDGGEKLRDKLVELSVEPEVGVFVIFNVLKGSFLDAARSIGEIETGDWEKGSCPACGGAPAVAYLEGEGGKRYLVCHRCHTQWRFGRVMCPFCNNTDNKGLGYFTIEEESELLRVDFCRACDGYIKTWDVRDKLDTFPEVEDLLTVRYDLAGEGEGFTRASPNIFGVWIGSPTEAESEEG
ncbi:MAG: formate dehydrogenase accessory protein FdhE [bacterium]